MIFQLPWTPRSSQRRREIVQGDGSLSDRASADAQRGAEPVRRRVPRRPALARSACRRSGHLDRIDRGAREAHGTVDPPDTFARLPGSCAGRGGASKVSCLGGSGSSGCWTSRSPGPSNGQGSASRLLTAPDRPEARSYGARRPCAAPPSRLFEARTRASTALSDAEPGNGIPPRQTSPPASRPGGQTRPPDPSADHGGLR